MVIKKCRSCGALVSVLKECHCPCDISCCDEVMETLKPNTVDAAKEKHIPTYKKEDDKVIITVNHVMEEEHFIAYLWVEYPDYTLTKEFKYTDKLEFIVPYEPGMVIYSYCNKHDLWSTKVD